MIDQERKLTAPAEILRFGDPRLNVSAKPVESDDPDMDSEARLLCETLNCFQRRHGWGRAISAPQIGIPKRLIAIEYGSSQRILMNPVLTWQSTEKRVVWDDCMSLPEVAVQVERYESLSLHFRNLDGTQGSFIRVPFDLSELLQHELDHLDGVLMTSRMTSGNPVVARELRPRSA